MKNNFYFYLEKVNEQKAINESIIGTVYIIYKNKDNFKQLINYIKFYRESSKVNKNLLDFLKENNGDEDRKKLLEYLEKKNLKDILNFKELKDAVKKIIESIIGPINSIAFNLVYKFIMKKLEKNSLVELEEIMSKIKPKEKLKNYFDEIKNLKMP